MAGPQLTAIAPRWIDSAPVAWHGQRVFFFKKKLFSFLFQIFYVAKVAVIH
jgi:hypothetical protein